MGKGDIKTKKGKLTRGTYGKTRQKKKTNVMVAPKKKATKKAAPAKKTEAKKVAPAATESSAKLTAAELKKMTVADLKALAAKNNIELPSKALKADLVKLLS